MPLCYMVSRGAWVLILLTLAYLLTANTGSLSLSQEIDSPHLYDQAFGD